MPWSDEDWEVIQECQKVPHANVWSNHSLRYEPTLCDKCRAKIESKEEK